MSRHGPERQAAALSKRLEALREAKTLAEGRLPDTAVHAAREVLERADARRSLSAEHTVVGFFGATGSGKSSLFNAVSGTAAARVAVRRPTTAEPLAAVWRPEDSEPLLDWLEVRQRHLGPQMPALVPDGAGLILLDLPDFDSTTAAHREIVQRLVGQVDVLVWVLDPQKYADAAVHHDFLRQLATHDAVMLVVLNQIDLLPEAEVTPVVASLRAVLAQDGLAEMTVLPVSAATGAGIGRLCAAIRAAIGEQHALTRRLSADVDHVAAVLAQASGGASDDGSGAGASGTSGAVGKPAGVQREDRRRLAAELAQAAYIDVVADALAASYRRQAAKRTGWPVTRWLIGLRPDPLRRLNLGRRDVAPQVNRTSLPTADASARARADTAVRTFADAISAGASGPWRAALRAAARQNRERLPDALDQAIATTDLSAARKSWWWPVFGLLQWLALAAAAGGLAWLGVIAVLGYLQLPVPQTPRVEGFPVPTLLLAAGLLLGIVLAVAARVLAAAAARARAAAVRRRLRDAVAQVAERLIIAPAQAELDRLERFRAALAVLTSR